MLVKLIVLILVSTLVRTESKHRHLIKQQHKNITGNVRSYSFEDKDDVGSGGSEKKRTVYNSVEEEFPMAKKEEIKTAFKDALATVLDGPTDEKKFEDADTLMAIVEVFDSTSDIFKLLTKKLKVKSNDFYVNIVGQNKELIRDIIKDKKITKSKWIALRDTKFRFFPSQKHYSSAEYTKDFFPDIMAFTIVFVAGTIDLSFTGDVYKCQLSKELDLLKNDIETSIQALIYKRLNMLQPDSSSWRWIDISIDSGRDKINFKDTYTGKKLCNDGCVLNDGTGKTPVVDAIMGVAAGVLDDAIQMFDFLDRFLAQLTEKKAFCFEKCVCPPEESVIAMERGDYVKDFPWSCLGKPKDDKSGVKSCKLPCGKYGETYDWCPTELEKRASSWKKCKVANQKTCAQGWFKRK